MNNEMILTRRDGRRFGAIICACANAFARSISGRIALVVLSAVFAQTALAQLTYTSVANGDWSNPATWNVGITTPGALDTAIIDGEAVTVTASEAAANVDVQGGSLTIQGAGELSVSTATNVAAGATLTVDNVAATVGLAATTIAGTLTVTNVGTLTFGTLDVDGTLTISSATTASATNLDVGATGLVDFNAAGTLTVSNTVSPGTFVANGGEFNVNNAAAIIVLSDGAYAVSVDGELEVLDCDTFTCSEGMSVNGTFTVTDCTTTTLNNTFTAGPSAAATVAFTAGTFALNQTVIVGDGSNASAMTLGASAALTVTDADLTVDAASTLNLAGGAFTYDGNAGTKTFTVASGASLDATAANVTTFTAASGTTALNLNSGATLLKFGDLIFDSTGTPTFNFSATGASISVLDALSVDDGATVTTGNNTLTVTGNATIGAGASGVLDCDNSNLAITGTTTIAVGATLQSRNSADGDTATFTGAVNVADGATLDLSAGGAGNVTFSGALTVGNGGAALNISGRNVYIEHDFTLNAGSTYTSAATTTFLTFQGAGTRTISFEGKTNNASITVNTTGTRTFTSNVNQQAGDINMQGGLLTVDDTVTTFTVAGGLDVNANGGNFTFGQSAGTMNVSIDDLNITGGVGLTSVDTFSAAIVTLSGAGIFDLNDVNTFTATGLVSLANTATLSLDDPSGTYNFNNGLDTGDGTNVSVIDLGGTVNVTGADVTVDANSDLDIRNATLTITNVDVQVDENVSNSTGTTNVTTLKGTADINFISVKTVTLGSLTIDGGVATTAAITGSAGATVHLLGNLTVGDNDSFTAGDRILNVDGTTTIGAGSGGTLNISSATATLDGATTIAAGATLIMQSAVAGDTVTFGGALTNQGTLGASAGALDAQVTVTGDFDAQAGSTTDFTGRTVEFQADFALDSGVTAYSTDGSTQFTFTTATSGTITFNAKTHAGALTVNLGSASDTRTFDSATTISGSVNITQGDVTASSGNIDFGELLIAGNGKFSHTSSGTLAVSSLPATVSSGGVFIVNNATAAATFADDLIVDGTLTVTDCATFTCNDLANFGAGAVCTATLTDGTFAFNGAVTIGDGSNASAVTVGASAVTTVTGVNLTITDNATLALGGSTFTFDSSGGNTLSVGAGATLSATVANTTTLRDGGTLTFNNNISFGNLVFDASGTWTVSTSAKTISVLGGLTVDDTVTAIIDDNTLAVTGNVAIGTGTSGILNLDDATASIGGTLTVNAGATFSQVSSNVADTLSVAGATTVSGSMDIDGTSVDANVSFAGLSVAAAPAFLDITARTVNVSGNFAVATTQPNFVSAATSLTFNGAAAQSVDFNALTFTGLLTLNNSAGALVTFGSAADLNGTVDILNGALYVAGATTVTADLAQTVINGATAGLKIGDSASASGYIATGQTIQMTDGSITIDSSAAPALSCATLDVTGGSITQTAGAITCSANLNFDGTLFTAGANVTVGTTFTLGDAAGDTVDVTAGTFQVNGTTTIDGTLKSSGSGVINLGDGAGDLVTVSATGSINMDDASADLTCSAGLTSAGAITLSSTAGGDVIVNGIVATFNGTPATIVGAAGALTANTGLVVSAATTLTLSSAAKINVSGSALAVNGTFNANNADVDISGGVDFNCAAGATVDFGTAFLDVAGGGDFNVLGGTCDVEAATIALAGGGGFYLTGGSVSDTSGGSGSLTSAAGGMSVTTPATLTLSDSTVTLNTTLTITGAFTSGSGLVTVTNSGAAGIAVDIDSTGAVTFGSGGLTVAQGDVDMALAGSVAFNGATAINGGGDLVTDNAGSLAIAAALTLTGMAALDRTTNHSAGTLTVTGTTSITANYTMSGAASIVSNGLMTIDDSTFSAATSITANAGLQIVSTTSATSFDLNAATLSVSGAALTINSTSGTTVDFDSGNVTVTGQNATVTAGTVALGTSGTVRLTSGDLQLNGGTVSANTKTLDLDAGNLVMNGGDLDINGATVNLDAGDINILAAGSDLTDTTTANGSITLVAGDIDLDAGTFVLTDATLSVTDNADAEAPLDVAAAATFTTGSGAATITDGSDGSADGIINNGTFSIGSGDLTVAGSFGSFNHAAGTLTISGDLSATAITTAPALIVAANVTQNVSTAVSVKGADFDGGTFTGSGGSFTSSANVTVDNATVNFTSTTEITLTSALTIGSGGSVDAGTGSGGSNDMSISSDLIVNAGGSAATFNGNARELTVAGNVQVSTGGGGAPDFDAPSQTMNVSGNLAVSAGTFDGNGGAINVTSNFDQTGGTVDVTSDTVTVSGSFLSSAGTLVLTSAVVSAGSTVDINPATFTTGGAAMKFRLTGSSNANVDFNGNTLSGELEMALNVLATQRVLVGSLIIDSAASGTGIVDLQVGTLIVGDGFTVTAISADTTIAATAKLIVGQGGGDSRYIASDGSAPETRNITGAGSIEVNSTTADPNYSLWCLDMDFDFQSANLTQTNGPIRIDSAITFGGSGTVTLNDTFYICANCTISGTVLVTTVDGIFTVCGTLDILNTATLDFNGADAALMGLVTIVDVGASLNAADAAAGEDITCSAGLTNNGVITLGAGALTVNGADLLNNSGATFTCGAGTLTIDNASNFGLTNAGTFTGSTGNITMGGALANTGTFTGATAPGLVTVCLNDTDDPGLTSSGTFTSGTGGIQVESHGVSFTGTNNVTINGALSLLDNAGATDNDFIVALTGGTLAIAANVSCRNAAIDVVDATHSTTGVVNATGTIDISPSSTYAQTNGTLTAAGLLTKSDAGTWSTSAASVINANLGLTVNAGTLDFNGASDVNVTGGNFIVSAGIFNGGSADIDLTSCSFQTSAASNLETCVLDITGETFEFAVSGGTVDVGGATVTIVGAAGGVTEDFEFTGGTVSDGGSNGLLTASQGGMNVLTPSSVTLSDTSVAVDRVLTITGAFTSGNTPATVVVTNSAAAADAINIDSTAAVAFGTGTLTTGAGDVNLALAGTVAFNGTANINGGGNLVTDAVGSMGIAANVTVSGLADINRAVTSHTAGTLAVTGTTMVSANYTLNIGATLTSTGLLTVDGGTFAANGTVNADTGMTLDGAANYNIGTAAALTDVDGGDFNMPGTYTGTFSAGSGSLIVDGNDIVVAGGTFEGGASGDIQITTSGDCTISSIFNLDNGDVLIANGNFLVNGGGDADLETGSVTITSGDVICDTGTMDVNAATIVLSDGLMRVQTAATVTDTAGAGSISITGSDPSALETTGAGSSIVLVDNTLTIVSSGNAAALLVGASTTFTSGTGLISVTDSTTGGTNGVHNLGTTNVGAGGLTVLGAFGFVTHMDTAVMTIAGNVTANTVTTAPAFVVHETITHSAGTIDVKGALFDTLSSFASSGGAFTSSADVTVTDATVSFTDTDTIDITGGFDLIITGGATNPGWVDGGNFFAADDFHVTGDIVMTPAAQNAVINANGRSLRVDGNIALVNAGAGTNDFNGSTTASTITGNVTIDEGTLDTAGTLTVSGNFTQTAGTATIGAATTTTITGNLTQTGGTTTLGAGATLSLGGNFDNNAGGLFDGDVGNVVLTGSAKTINASVTATNTLLQNLTVNAGAVYTLASPSAIQFNATGTFTNNGTFSVTDTNSQIVFALGITTSADFAGAAATTLGSLTVGAGTTLNSLSAASVNVLGNISNTAGTIDWAPTNKVNVNFSGVAAQTITTNTTTPMTTELGDVTMTGVSLTLAAGAGFVSVQGLTIPAGEVFDITDNTIEIHGPYSNSATGTLTAGTASTVVFHTDTAASNLATGGTDANHDFEFVDFASGIRQLAVGQPIQINNMVSLDLSGGALKLNNNDSTFCCVTINHASSFIDLESAILTITGGGAGASDFTVLDGYYADSTGGGLLDIRDDFIYTSAIAPDYNGLSSDIEVGLNADVSGNFVHTSGMFEMTEGTGTPVTVTLGLTTSFDDFEIVGLTDVDLTSAVAADFVVNGALTLNNNSRIEDNGSMTGATVVGTTSIYGSTLDLDQGGPYVFGAITATIAPIAIPPLLSLEATGTNTITTGAINFIDGAGSCTLQTQDADLTFGDIVHDNASNETSYTFRCIGTGNIFKGANPSNNVTVNGGGTTGPDFLFEAKDGTVSVGNISHTANNTGTTYSVVTKDGASVTVGNIAVSNGSPTVAVNGDSAVGPTGGTVTAGAVSVSNGTPAISLLSSSGAIVLNAITVTGGIIDFDALASLSGNVTCSGAVSETGSSGASLIGFTTLSGLVTINGNVTLNTNAQFSANSTAGSVAINGGLTAGGASLFNFSDSGDGGDTFSITGDVVLNSTAATVMDFSTGICDVTLGGSLTQTGDSIINASNFTGNLTITDEVTLSDGHLLMTTFTGNVVFNDSASATPGLTVGAAATGITATSLAGNVTIENGATISGGAVDFSGLAPDVDTFSVLTGDFTVANATVDVSGNGGFSVAGDLSLTNATLDTQDSTVTGINIGGAGGVTLASTSTWTVSSGGDASTNLMIPAGGLNISGGSTVTADSLSDATTSLSVAGAVIVGAGGGADQLSISAAAGAVALPGTVTVNSTHALALAINSTDGALSMGATTVTDGNVDLGDGSSTVTIDGLSVAADTTDIGGLVANSVTIDGDFALTGAGIVDFTGSNALNFLASYDDDSSVDDSVIIDVAAAVTFTGTAAHTLDSGTDAQTGDVFPASITIAGGAYTISDRTLETQADIVLTGGSVDQGTEDVTVGADGTGNFSVGGTSTGWTVGDNTLDVNGTLVLDGTVAATFSATSAGATVIDVLGNATIGGGTGAVTATVSGGAANVIFGGTLTIGSGAGGGSLTLGSGGAVNMDVTGVATIDAAGAFSVTNDPAHDVDFASNLIMNSGGTFTMDDGLVDVTGTTAINGDATFTGGTLTCGGAATVGATGSLDATGSSTGDAIAFNNGVSSGGTVTLGAGDVNVTTAPLNVTGGSVTLGTGTVNVTSTDVTMSAGTFNGGASGLLNVVTSGDIQLTGGTFDIQGATVTLDDGDITVVNAGFADTTETGGSLTLTSGDLDIGAGGAVTLSDAILSITDDGDGTAPLNISDPTGSFESGAGVAAINGGDGIAAGGNFTISTGGSVTLSGANAVYVQSAGTGTIGGMLTIPAVDPQTALTVSAGATLALEADSVITLGGSGAGKGLAQIDGTLTSAVGAGASRPVIQGDSTAPANYAQVNFGATALINVDGLVLQYVGNSADAYAVIFTTGATIDGFDNVSLTNSNSSVAAIQLNLVTVNDTTFAEFEIAGTLTPANFDATNYAGAGILITVGPFAGGNLYGEPYETPSTVLITWALPGPQVTAVSPLAHSFDSDTLAAISATFDAQMNDADLSSFVVVGGFSGKINAGSFTNNNANPGVLTFATGTAFRAGETIHVSLTNGLTDTAIPPAGLEFPYVWSFRIAVTNATGATLGSDRTFGAANAATNAVIAGDFNGDGFVDLAVGINGQNKIYFNDQAGQFTSEANFGTGNDQTRALATADFDLDGDLDIVVGNDGAGAGEQSALYLNDGNGVFTFAANFGGSSDLTQALDTGDFNGDSYPDVVAGNNGQNSIYLNDGAAGFTGGTAVGGAVDDTRAIKAVDFNNDGKVDIVSGESGSQSKVYYNNGLASFTTSVNFGGAADITNALALADFNGDGYVDIAAGNDGQSAVYFSSNGTSIDATPGLFGGAADATFSLAVADFDGDGDLDIAAGNDGGLSQTNAIYLNDDGASTVGTGIFTALFETFSTSTGITAALAAFDADNDGDIDLAIGNLNLQSIVALNGPIADVGDPRIVVSVGTALEQSYSAFSNQQGVVAGQWKLQALDGTGAVNAVTFTFGGTVDQADALSRMRLFSDSNGSGAKDSGEAQLGTQVTTFTQSTVTFSFSKVVLAPTSTLYLLAVVDLNGNATNGETLNLFISSAVQVSSVAPTSETSAVPVVGDFPASGPTVYIGNAAKPQLGSISLQSAFATLEQSGIELSSTVKNVGGNAMTLDSAKVTLTAGSTTHVLTPDSTVFGSTALGLGAQTTVDLSFTLPPEVAAGTYQLDISVFGTDDVTSAQVSDVGALSKRTFTVVDGLAFIVAELPKATEDLPYIALVAVIGGLPPVTVTVDPDSLPDGLVMSASGLISGIPRENGEFELTFTATDASGEEAEVTLTLEVSPAFTQPTGTGSSAGTAGQGFNQNASIFTTNLPVGVVTIPYGFNQQGFKLSGAPIGGIWSLVSGELPAGFALSATGLISGTPTVAGTSEFTVRLIAGDSEATQKFVLTVLDESEAEIAPPPRFVYRAASGMNLLESVEGAITGLEGDAVSPADVSDIPDLNYVDIESTDEDGPALVEAYFFDVDGNGEVSQGDVIRGVLSESVIIQKGSIADVDIEDGSFGDNPGFSAENRSNTFSVILGTSAALTVDFSQLVMVAGSGLTDLAGNGVVQSSAVIQSGSASSTSIDLITLNGEPVEEFTSVNIEWQTKPNSDDWTIDIALNLGGDLYLELATGVEDTGLFVWSVPGEITGPGYTVLITGHNATIEEDFTDESSASFSIVPAGSLNNGEVPDFVTILDIDIPDGEVGIDYEADMIAIGGVAPFVWTVESGSLPGGLDINDSTGDISGTPTDSGVSTFTVLVTDADGNTASRSFQITVVDALELLVMELPSGVVGEAYSATLIATGGGEPLSWEISSGSLPTGVSLEGGDDGEETLAGTVSGSEGRFVFTVTVTDELGGERSGVFQITVVSTSRLISSNDTGLFSIAPVSGAQLEISGTGLRGFRDVQALAFDSENGVYYASDIDSGTLLRLDPETGLGTLIGTIGFSDVRALAYNTANDTLYGIDTAANELITISTATGAGTSVGTVNGGFTDIGSLAVDPSSSTLYAVATNVDKLITINTSNANASEVGVVGLDNVQALTFNSAESGSDKLFGVDLNSGDLITINVSTGAGTSVDTLGVDDIRGLAYDASAGTLIGVAATTAQVVEIDTTTAETDNIGSVGFDFADLAYHSTNEVIYGINTLTNELVAIDPDTYFPAVVGEIGVGTIEGLAYRAATNTLYGSDTSTGRLVVISATTGAGAVVGNFGGGITAVRGLAFDPAGPTLYGCDDGNNRLVRININSGAATNVGGTFGGAFTNIRGFAYDTGGTTLYGTDTGTGQLVSVNTTTGTATAVGETGFSICGLAYDTANATLVGVSSDLSQIVTIDSGTGRGAAQNALGLADLAGLAYDPASETLYGVDSDTDHLYSIDALSGEASSIGPLTNISGVEGLAYDPDTTTLYGVAPGAQQLVEIDTSTGVATLIGAGALGQAIIGLAWDSGSDVLYGTDGASLFLVNTGTGVATLVAGAFGGAVADVQGLAYDAAGDVLYGIDETLKQVVSIDTGSGIATPLGSVRPDGLRSLEWR